MSVCECETVYAYTVTLGVLVHFGRRQVVVLMSMCVTFLSRLPHREEALRSRATKGWLNNKEALIVFLGYFQSSQAMCGEKNDFRGLALKSKSSLNQPTDKISFYGNDKQNSLMSVCCKNIKIGGLPWEGMFYGRKDTARIHLICVITFYIFWLIRLDSLCV